MENTNRKFNVAIHPEPERSGFLASQDKLIKENDTHVWRETEAGIGYVYPKNAFWLFLEKQAEESIINSFSTFGCDDGYDNGDGDSDGDGYGDGDGNGFGYGNGYGDGDGDGHGDGYGDGWGNGYGNGFCYNYTYGRPPSF